MQHKADGPGSGRRRCVYVQNALPASLLMANLAARLANYHLDGLNALAAEQVINANLDELAQQSRQQEYSQHQG